MASLVLFLIIILVVILIFVKSRKGNGDYKYIKNGPLFSAAERSFLGVLELAVGDQYKVFGKVRVADILCPAKGMDRRSWQTAFNKISAKHFDFVLCNKATVDIVAVIELDDKSHKQKKSIARDMLLEGVCASAELRLIRFEAKSGYQVQEVKEKILRALTHGVIEETALS